jgi:hypothetical protein
MSETSGAAGKKTKVNRAKPAREGERAWTRTPDGAGLSRTISFGSTDEAGKAARKAVVGFQKAGQPIDLRLDGSTVTIRIAGAPGKIDEQAKRLVNRIAPRDPARKAAKDAKPAGAEG